MALKLSVYSAPTVIAAAAAIKGQRNDGRLVMCANNHHIPEKNRPITKSSHRLKNKLVYEDSGEGIVCYKDDESGEITCEGYDEGPRFLPHQISRSTNCDLRSDAEVMKILQRCFARELDTSVKKEYS